MSLDDLHAKESLSWRMLVQPSYDMTRGLGGRDAAAMELMNPTVVVGPHQTGLAVFGFLQHYAFSSSWPILLAIIR